MPHSSTDAPLEFAFANGLPRSLRGVMSTRAINRFFAAMESESDRGLVIGMISVLDDLMELRLSKIFRYGSAESRKSAMRAFGTFGQRIHGLHALGRIDDDVAADLHRLREQRNAVSHKWAAFSLDTNVERTFVDPLFRDRVAWTDKKTGEPIAMNARRKLMWVVMILILTLHKPAGRRTA
jgi:hypothetical protein